MRRNGFEQVYIGLDFATVDWEEYPLGDDYLHFMLNDKEFKREKMGRDFKIRKIIKPATINIEGLRKPKVGT